MRTEALKNFIRENGALFWYTPDDKGENVTDELLVFDCESARMVNKI